MSASSEHKQSSWADKAGGPGWIDVPALTANIFATITDRTIDIKSLQNRLLKVCYVPPTSASLNRLLFFFFAVAINSTNEANKAGGMRRFAVYIT